MSFITDIQTSWKESLGFFAKQELKNLVLVSLNTFRRAAKIVLWNFGAVFFCLGLGLVLIGLLFETIPYINELFFPLCSFAILFATFIWSLASRVSTERKDFAYFKLYLPRFFGYLVIVFIASFFSFIPIRVRFFLIQSFLNFAIFFFLDAEYALKNIFISIFNGLKMVMYFFPFLIVFPLSWFLISEYVIRAFSFGFFSIIPIVFDISMPLLSIVIYSALYTKIKHSNYRLFFKS